MIYYLVTQRHRYTMGSYLDHWARSSSKRIHIVAYDTLASCTDLYAGTYIFSDLERLFPVENELCLFLWNELSQKEDLVRLLNHPGSVMRRYKLLRTLHANRQNSFAAYRLRDMGAPMRFPVFVRHENEHEGSLTPLLTNTRDLDRALVELFCRGYGAQELLIVEFCNTVSPDGIFRKYSAFRIGDQILPRRLIFNLGWMAKNNSESLINERHAQEEQTFLETNPHENWLRTVFEAANIEYGRIDYSFSDGRPQVWEINTNPTIFLQPGRYHPLHIPAQQLFLAKLGAAFEAVDHVTATASPIRIRIPHDLLNRTAAHRRTMRWRGLSRDLTSKVRHVFPGRWSQWIKSLMLKNAASLVDMKTGRHSAPSE
jgi:hypothetical protein